MSVSTLASFEYLERLPGTTFRRLYQQPSTALAIFRRMLPHLGTWLFSSSHAAMLTGNSQDICYGTSLHEQTSATRRYRTLGSSQEQEVRESQATSRNVLTRRRERDQSLSLLSRLHIVTITAPTREDNQTVTLTKNFCTSLRLALSGGGEQQSFGIPSHDSPVAGVDVEFLDKHARDQWEDILHFVVNSVGNAMRLSGAGPTQPVRQLLEAGKLVATGKRAGGGITQAGFSFLLQEVNAQVWTLLLLWIENAEKVGGLTIVVLWRLTGVDGLGIRRRSFIPVHARIPRIEPGV